MKMTFTYVPELSDFTIDERDMIDFHIYVILLIIHTRLAGFDRGYLYNMAHVNIYLEYGPSIWVYLS